MSPLPLAVFASALAGTDVSLPVATSAVPVDGPYATVVVTADDQVRFADVVLDADPPRKTLALPVLATILAGWQTDHPDGSVLVEADARASTQAVVAVMASAKQPVRLVWATAGPGRGTRGLVIRKPVDDPVLRKAPLVVHVTARGLWVGRLSAPNTEGVWIPRKGGVLDLATLRALLQAEAARAEPFLLLTVDFGLRYYDGVVVLDTALGAGLTLELVCAGPPGTAAPPPDVPGAPPIVGLPDVPAQVAVAPNGDTVLTYADQPPETIPHAAVAAYEEHCADTCALVLRTTDGRRVALGSRDPGAPAWIFCRPVFRYADSLPVAPPARTGELWPLVVGPPVDTPASTP